MLAQSVQLSSVAEKSGVIRVTDYLQQCALTGDGKGGTKGKDIEQCALTGHGEGGTEGKDRAVCTHRGWEGWN